MHPSCPGLPCELKADSTRPASKLANEIKLTMYLQGLVFSQARSCKLTPKPVCLVADFKKAQHEGLTALNAHVADVTGERYAISDESELLFRSYG